MTQKNDHPERARRWIACSDEQDYLGENRKEGKAERKQAIATDRSKFKKTDKEKYLRGLEKEKEGKLTKGEQLEGRVVTIVPQGIIVDYQGEKIQCILKGLLKKDKTQAKNLVAVGDDVLFEKTAEAEGIISHIQPRRTLLSRADNLSRRKEQLIAVNIDQAIITVSVVNPPLKSALIDRYIIAAQKGGMKPLIVINKVDLLNAAESDESGLLEVEQLIFEEAKAAYTEAGIPLLAVSVITGEGIEELKAAMAGTTSVFSGPSGVGKSSLINCMTGLHLKTGEVVDKTKKGSHTTTTTQLIPLKSGGWCVDTPGIKSFGVWDLKRDEVEGYFTEIHALGAQCKFADCSHTHEEHCAVREALDEGKLSWLRFDSYQALCDSSDEKHVRR